MVETRSTKKTAHTLEMQTPPRTPSERSGDGQQGEPVVPQGTVQQVDVSTALNRPAIQIAAHRGQASSSRQPTYGRGKSSTREQWVLRGELPLTSRSPPRAEVIPPTATGRGGKGKAVISQPPTRDSSGPSRVVGRSREHQRREPEYREERPNVLQEQDVVRLAAQVVTMIGQTSATPVVANSPAPAVNVAPPAIGNPVQHDAPDLPEIRATRSLPRDERSPVHSRQSYHY